MVNVFDLRMPERGIPLAAVSVMPSFVRFLPPGADGIKRLYLGDKNEDSSYDPTILAVSTDGYMQVSSWGYVCFALTLWNVFILPHYFYLC